MTELFDQDACPRCGREAHVCPNFVPPEPYVRKCWCRPVRIASPVCRIGECIMLFDPEPGLWRCTRACLNTASEAEMRWWMRWNVEYEGG